MNLQYLAKKILNIPGFKTNKKIIVFTVDDYGSIRMPSRKVFNDLEKKGVNFGNCRYSTYDALESNTDLEELFNVLLSKKDSKGNHPVFTAVVCPCNPDFEKIEENGFSEYYYETFAETAMRYHDHDAIHSLYHKGIDLNIFVPELHNREHLDAINWIDDLNKGNPALKLAFQNKFFSLNSKYSVLVKRNYQVAMSYQNKEENITKQTRTLNEGAKLFHNLFGYDSLYFTPPNGTINYRHFETLSKLGLKLIDVSRINKEPRKNSKYKRHIHYLGQKNKYNQRFLVRNCIFEPNSHIKDPISNCLKMISLAFNSRQPAIISSHRVNFGGYLYPQNREKGLKDLSQLLDKIQKEWPDVEFMSIRQLYELMESR